MKFSLTLPVFVIAALFSGCSAIDESNPLTEISTENGKLQQISIDKVPVEVKVVKLSELISGFRIIPLETKPECMISNTEIVFAKNFFLVATQNFPGAARLYRFDIDGKYIDEIGRSGRGPGEHSGYMWDAIRCYEGSKTILASWIDNEPQLFDYNGHFLKEITMPYDLMSGIEKWNDSIWFSVGSFAGEASIERDSFALVFYNDDGKVLKKIPRGSYPENKSAFTPNSWGHSLYNLNEQLKFFMSGNDTIFCLENMDLKPTGLIIPGKNVLPFNKTIAPENLPGKESYSILSETQNNWFLQRSIIESAEVKEYIPGRWGGSYKLDYQYIIIDKKSKKAITATLEDDIFKIFPPEALISTLKWHDNKISITVPPNYLAKMISELDESSLTDPDAIKAIEEIKKIPQEDNPVLFVFSLKDRFRVD